MAFDNLSEKLSSVFKKLRGKGKLSKSDIQVAMREIRIALLEADVSYKIAKDFTNKIGERSIGSEVMESLTPGQMVVKIVNEELVKLMGEKTERLNFPSKPPLVIMMCGLQGSGKTTHVAKLGKKLKSEGHRPLLVACDVYRPAAIEQLKILGDKIDVPVFEMGNENPVKISENAVKHAKDHGNNVVILDTAGRLHIDEVLMDELKNISNAVSPQEILLVVDAMTGQDAVNIAKSFNDLLDITGVVLTKLDGDTRGGVALSVKATTGKPIKFSGTGEKLDDLEVFHPGRMASRILGMGDVLSLIEEAESKLDEKKALKLANKIEKNKMDLNDLYEQFEQVKSMGSIKSILSKIPGIANKIKDQDIDERAIDRTMSIILSMTPEERRKPSILNASRKRRVASGSGVKVEDVNKLLKQFEQMQSMVKKFKGGKRGFGGFGGLGGLRGFGGLGF